MFKQEITPMLLNGMIQQNAVLLKVNIKSMNIIGIYYPISRSDIFMLITNLPAGTDLQSDCLQ